MKTIVTPFKQVEGSNSSVFFESLLEYHRGAISLYDQYGPKNRSDRRIMGLYLPPFQRPEVWSIEQKQRFIESCLLGLDIGRIVISHATPQGKFWETDGWLIDGQQRMTALRDFYDGKFTIFNDISFVDIWEEKIDYANDWYTYKSEGEIHRILPRSHWKRLCFPTIVLRDTPVDVLEHLYIAMNYGGTPHQ